ncbi:hypothetical protein M422DRAFT_263892 [Sphaerobolus stellatus SS14]|uniref:Uncharacterized protein n=1 Tax=Sphaerobolus stellatus (strain SS14) TaxID=990650 RepID=A0A0C9TUR5_SPHS4|nr:hypothetical protein M422DRAFT_263892 [Sphaerobolus stellatus SS14]
MSILDMVWRFSRSAWASSSSRLAVVQVELKAFEPRRECHVTHTTTNIPADLVPRFTALPIASDVQLSPMATNISGIMDLPWTRY